MLKAGVHFGHQSSRWHPKMARFIFGKRNNIHIIDLEKTLEQLEKAVKFVSDSVAKGGYVMFVGTKAQTKGFVEDGAKRAGMPFVTERWLGGTLTNFGEIAKLTKRLADLKRGFETGELKKKYNKKELLDLSREQEELEKKVGGIATMNKLPEAIVVFDVRNELTAVKEANRRGIPVVALCDTNINPMNIDYVIPANDDAVKSIEMMVDTMADAALAGKKNQKAVKRPVARRKVAIK